VYLMMLVLMMIQMIRTHKTSHRKDRYNCVALTQHAEICLPTIVVMTLVDHAVKYKVV
jgi:hypothetical protein